MGDAPYSETMVMRRRLDEWKVQEPRASMMTGPFLEAAVRPLLDLVDQIAGMRTDDEIQDGLSGDDAAETIGSLVAIARRYSDRRPDPSTVYRHPDDDAYPMTAPAPQGPDCTACKGTGEVVDYPPDDDERLVACGRCGGTGEEPR